MDVLTWGNIEVNIKELRMANKTKTDVDGVLPEQDENRCRSCDPIAIKIKVTVLL